MKSVATVYRLGGLRVDGSQVPSRGSTSISPAVPPILIVEDDASQTELLERVLRRARIANPIRAIADGSRAEDYLTGSGVYGDRTTHPLPVLVLLDLGIPGLAGLELLATIRSAFAADEMPVIVLSGSMEADDIDRAFEIGANSYLVKPVAFSALIDTLENLELWRAILPVSSGPEVPNG